MLHVFVLLIHNDLHVQLYYIIGLGKRKEVFKNFFHIFSCSGSSDDRSEDTARDYSAHNGEKVIVKKYSSL